MGKRILITGATGGIGGAIARQLAHPHNHLILQGRNEHLLRLLHAEIVRLGATADLWLCDFSTLTEADLLEQQVNVDDIDIYIHSSGHSLYKMLVDTKVSEWDDLFQVHVRSAFMLTKHVLPAMIAKRKGRIILISSIWGEIGASFEVAYSAAKGALSAYTKALAKEIAPTGVTVNAIAPGAIETKMVYDHLDAAEITALQERIPIGRLGKPEEIAYLVNFLASEESGYITGQVLQVNGGW